MTGEQFQRWLELYKASGRADNDKAVAEQLDVSQNALVEFKRKGCNRRTALACAALAAGLEVPFAGEKGAGLD
jgi:hypothetical protein